MVALFSIGFLSCSNDDDETNANIVYGTKWYTTDSMYDALFGTKGGPNYIVLDFSSKTKVEYYVKQGDVIKTIFDTMDYRCEGTTVTIFTDPGNYAIYEINGRKMTKKNNEGLRFTSFIKQD